MAENMSKWPSKREPTSKIRPSDGCGRDAVPLAVGRWHDFHEFGLHLGNVDLVSLMESGINYVSRLINHFMGKLIWINDSMTQLASCG